MKNSRKKHSAYKTGRKFGEWTLVKRLGSGGNGVVWKVTRPGHEPHAIKLLTTINAEAYARFKIETETLEKLGNTVGIIPLIEKYIPDLSSGVAPWFVMPIAMPFNKVINDLPPLERVIEFIKLGEILSKLHNQRIAHRDIKPANFLYLDGQPCFSDFGLVKYPDRINITRPKRDVGAKFTMAPEMRRNASEADGLPADVYSFSKSLWIALTREELGFDGQYNPVSALSLSNYMSGLYTTKLDRLLVECTDPDPALRPAIDDVVLRLQEWTNIIKNFHKQNAIEWNELTQKLFPLGAPSQTTWSDLDAICAVLSEVAKVPALNHMFYPNGGGNTITNVSRAGEDGMIELHIGYRVAEILKPSKLTYESFGNDTNWSYFRLEAEPIEASGVDGAMDSDNSRETLTEIEPGLYVSYRHWDENEFNGETLPKSARLVSRYLKGAFVFFSTSSAYNGDSSTYDGRHNKMTEEQFRNYIKRNSTPR